MKTIHQNSICDICNVSYTQNSEGYITLVNGNLVKVQTFCQCGYIKNPLLFIPLTLSDNTKLQLIKRFDEWYGNTAQSVTCWALEFQLVVRMILCGHLIINPVYLEIDEVIKEILEIIQ